MFESGNVLKFTALVGGSTIITLVLLSLLPNDKYLRYKALDIGVYSKASWIYERIVISNTPIDIAFVGTSHTLNGIDSKLIEDSLNLELEDKLHVANFAMPHFGRDLHKTISKLLLTNKKPKLLLIEIRQSEERDQHPANHYLSDSFDLLNAPLLINKRYFDNLIRLPLRELKLFTRTYLPFIFENEERPPPNEIVDHKNYTETINGTYKRDKFLSTNEAELALKQWREKNSFKLNRENKVLNFLYFNANWQGLNSIVEMAKENGVELAFVYLPNYGSAPAPVDMQRYLSLAPIIFPEDKKILSDSRYWYDLGHLNANGALIFSKQLGKQISSLMERSAKHHTVEN
jgi:hypothetical protein